jgi:hypothetical protein
MTGRSMITALALTGGLTACKATQQPVPIVGPVPAAAVLAGHWSGEYVGALSGRSGTIDLTVTSHGDSASGEVVMIPAGFAKPLRPWRDPALDPKPRNTATPSILTIRLIWVEGNRVSGALDPYADPQTGERLITTFDGRLAGDTIAGTFVTNPGPAPGGESGRWIVIRERPPAGEQQP